MERGASQDDRVVWRQSAIIAVPGTVTGLETRTIPVTSVRLHCIIYTLDHISLRTLLDKASSPVHSFQGPSSSQKINPYTILDGQGRLKMDPLVSVITPAYNSVKFIRETVDSVLNQTYPAIEYIVVDDGSQDGTYEILRQYESEERISVLSHENRSNKGQSASLNLGLKTCQGKYVVILDSDDFLDRDKIRQQVGFMEGRQEFGAVYGQAQVVSEDGNPLYKLPEDNHTESSDPNNLLLDCYIPSPGALLFRKSVLDKVGFFEEKFRASQDHDLLVRVAESAPLAFQKGVVFFYRKHGNSISELGLEKRWLAGFEILDRASKRYQYKRSTIRKRRALLNFRLGHVYFSQERYGKALMHMLRAGLGDPVRSTRVLFGLEKVL